MAKFISTLGILLVAMTLTGCIHGRSGDMGNEMGAYLAKHINEQRNSVILEKQR